MSIVSDTIFYILTFCAVYAQIFFLVTFFENRKKIIIRTGEVKLSKYPAVTIVVPCWNEEKTVYRTMRSILGLNYPKDKIKILIVDDGSTDGTWNIIKKFERQSNIRLFRKENGGKHTALNLGLEHAETEFFACLDADSMVHPEALVRIMSYFEKDNEAMAVTPSIIVHNPKGIVQHAQNIEYHIGVFIKRGLGFIGAIHVTPGPFTVFRKAVFNHLGPYAFAHHTEDMEIAYRMQKHRFKIDYCNDAYVYTNAPKTAHKLYRQRVRWLYGFINNTIDYKNVLLRKKYGNFALFTVPAGIISMFTASFLIGRVLFNLGNYAVTKLTEFNTIGLDVTPSPEKFDLFFFNTSPQIFITVFIVAAVIFSVVVGQRITENRWRFSFKTVYFFIIFSLVAPFWLLKAIFNTLIALRPAWR